MSAWERSNISSAGGASSQIRLAEPGDLGTWCRRGCARCYFLPRFAERRLISVAPRVRSVEMPVARGCVGLRAIPGRSA
jgi:hypothetical protein